MLLFTLLSSRNRSEAVEEGLYLTNQDLTLRRTELLNLQEKHRDEMEKMNAKLESLEKKPKYCSEQFVGEGEFDFSKKHCMYVCYQG